MPQSSYLFCRRPLVAAEAALRLVEHPASRGRLSNALEGLLYVVYRAYRARPVGDDYYGGYQPLKEGWH